MQMDHSPAGLRAQGHPPADRQPFDRNLPLAQSRETKLRQTMKRPPRIDLQRCTIAGISPALVDHCFPVKREMREAAALPIIDSHVATIVEVIEPSDVKHENLIHTGSKP